MNTSLITIFGGSGFLGKHVTSLLAKQNYYIRIPTTDMTQSRELRVLGSFTGQVAPLPFSQNLDEVAIDNLVKESDAVINCIGILHETKRNTFYNTHVKIPAAIAKSCRKNKVQNLIHVSSIAANQNSLSQYAKTKAQGEEILLKEFPNVQIIRPDVIFGREDKFINLIIAMSRFSPSLPLIGGGKNILKPVYVEDVAKFMLFLLSKEHSESSIYNLQGNESYSMKELHKVILKSMDIKRLLVTVPYSIANMIAFVMEKLPFDTILSRDNIKMIKEASPKMEKDGVNPFHQAGIDPMPFSYALENIFLKNS